MPVLRPSGSDFTSFVKAAAQYVPAGRNAKPSKSGGVPVALPGLGAIVRTSQVGALASPTTSAVVINGVTPPAGGGGPPPPPPPVPPSITGLKVWLDGSLPSSMTSNASSNVITWSNLAGGVNATAVSTSNRPTYVANAYNSLGAVQFTVGSRITMGPIAITSPSRCYLLVLTTPVNSVSANKETPFLGDDIDRVSSLQICAYDHPNGVEYYVPGNFRQTETYGSFGNYPRPNYDSTPWMMSLHSTTSPGSGLYFNGNVNRATLSNTTFATGTFTDFIGSTALNMNQFNINEYLIYDANITSAQRQKAEGYLAWKWGLQSALPSNHLYKTAAPTAAS